eukprot:456812-Prymnesium_polylepis.1
MASTAARGRVAWSAQRRVAMWHGQHGGAWACGMVSTVARGHVHVCVERAGVATVSYTHLTLPTICSV